LPAACAGASRAQHAVTTLTRTGHEEELSRVNESQHGTDPTHAVDGRTVRRALRPQRTWPWPDLEVKIALVERWVVAGVDLRGPLRRLTWPLIRRTNLGFVSALVSRGVVVPQNVVDAARDALRTLVNGRAVDAEWRRYAQWFAELDPDLAITVLQRLAEPPSRPETERHRALIFLHETSPEDAVWVAEVLASDIAVPRSTRFRIGEMLADRDLATAIAVFDRVATRSRHGEIRNQAAEFIRRHAPDKAADLSARTAADPDIGDSHRLTASRHVLSHDRRRGIDLLFGLLATASGNLVLVEVMNDLRREDPKRLTTRLDALRSTGAPSARHHFVQYLVEHLGGGPEEVAELATDPDLSPEKQLQALDIDRAAATPEIVTGIIERFKNHSPAKVRAIALLAKLSPDPAFGYLNAIVTDPRLAFHTRMEAVAQTARPLGSHRTTALYRTLASADEATAEQRDAAASATAKIDVVKSRELYEDLARRRDLRVEDRLRFAKKAGRDRSLVLLREFAHEPGEDDAMRVVAALEAASTGNRDDRLYLRKLAATPSVSYSLRERVIKKLTPAERTAVLATIADSVAEDIDVRLAATTALGNVDSEKAAMRFDALADDRSLPTAIRNRAREAARRLRSR
jgi:hypothetical protein